MGIRKKKKRKFKFVFPAQICVTVTGSTKDDAWDALYNHDFDIVEFLDIDFDKASDVNE